MNNEYNNDNNNNNNVVQPTMVDLNKVEVTNQDNMLNRERANIVSASIQANDAIDEKKALEVNNQIKYKKMNPIVKVLMLLFGLAVAVVCIYYVLQLVNDIMHHDDPVVTTTTTTKPLTASEKIKAYAVDNTKVRKFTSENHIIVLLPNMDSKTNQGIPYAFVDTNGVIAIQKHGLQESIDKLGNNVVFTDNGVTIDNEVFTQYDTEYKSYYNKEARKYLYVDGNAKKQFGIFVEENADGTLKVSLADLIENENMIKVGNIVFTKVEDSVMYSNIKLDYVY